MGSAAAQQRLLASAGVAAGSRAPRSQVAEELIAEFHAVAPYDAMQISLFDPFAQCHRTVANEGYADRIIEYLDTEYAGRDLGFQEIVNERRPMRMCDTSFEYRESYSYVHYWGAEGYRDGMTTALFADDGRYVGMACVSTAEEGVLTDEVRDFTALLSPVLGAAFDPFVDVAGWLDDTAQGRRLMIRADGAVLEPQGEAATPAVAVETVVGIAQAMQRAGQPVRRGLVAGPTGALVEVHLVRTSAPRLDTAPVVLATLADAGQPFGLTPRETEVLRHLIAGGSNREIANALGLAQRTVATHVEHLLEKLGVDTRTAATGHAIEHGLVRLDIPIARAPRASR